MRVRGLPADNRQTHRHTGKWPDRHTGSWPHRHTDTQGEGQTGTHGDGQTGSQTQTDSPRPEGNVEPRQTD